MSDKQYRTSQDVRASAEGQGFSGHASHFWSVDSYITAVAPGAFKKTIRERGDRILVMFNHNPERVIGKAVDLKEDKTGLYFNAKISDTTEGRDLMTLLRDDVPLGVSFSFNVLKSRTATDDDPLDLSQYNVKPADVEVITEVKLYELGPVPYPANELADIASVRKTAEDEYFTSFLNALSADSVNEVIVERARQIAEAYESRAGAEPLTPPIDADALDRQKRRERTLRFATSLRG